MNFRIATFLGLVLAGLSGGKLSAQTFEAEFAPLIEESCIACHDADTQTRLNFEALGRDLDDEDTFRQWEEIFDRVRDGEMPPSSEPRPDATQVEQAVDALKNDLITANLSAQRKWGRVRSRRLTRLEYEYTLRDLLLIHDDLAAMLPAETHSAGFDTVGASQGISPIHIRSYLQAADQAIESAIRLERRPSQEPVLVDYLNSRYVNDWHNKPLRLGGNVTRKLSDAVALFVDLDYIMRSDLSGLRIKTPGRYRITTEAYAYQAKTPVTLKLILASERRGGAELLGAFDLLPDETRTVEVEAVMRPGDYLYPTVDDIDYPEIGFYSVGAKNYRGEGIAIKSMNVEGPLVQSWPPASTSQLLTGVRLEPTRGRRFALQLTNEPIEHVRDILARLLPRAFRRPPDDREIESFVALAEPVIDQGRDFTEVVRVPLRSVLSSPQFLFHGGDPGTLDDFSLATRLSYFLWKSMPDDELYELAAAGQLSDSRILARQVERMLDDEKSTRFVRDFVGQWLGLNDLDATTPDQVLYPEFDDVLRQSMLQETESFFAELISEDLAVRNLIDSDFAFLNRRLAEHYGIEGVAGQVVRKVDLPEDSPRGGVLTQASVLKVTANGTVTSPVMRGNFVLTTLLGDPPHPPPPNVGSIEPDTRGTTTIRESLAAHRNTEACARCHRKIDPPGFALESFDPIGGFRTRYRSNKNASAPAFFPGTNQTFYSDGPIVDASGATADGQEFSGIRDFKQLLLAQEDQVARHLIAQLIVYSTGGEIQFADRDNVESIAQRLAPEGYTVRKIIHEVVDSELFRMK